MLDLQFVFPKIKRRFYIPECFPRFRPKNALILSSSGNALILSSSGVSWPSDFRCKRWSFSFLSIHWCRRSPPDLGSTQDEAKAPQPESVLNIRYGIAGNRTIGAHTPVTMEPAGSEGSTQDLIFRSALVLQRPVMDPCLAVGFLPLSSGGLRVFLWYLGFNFESMITLKLSLCHAVDEVLYEVNANSENWMIVGRKRGHVSLSTKQGSRIVISILCMPLMAGYVHPPKLGLPNIDEANISCNPAGPHLFLQVINNCYNTHFQVPILPRLKLTTIISFFYGHYGGDEILEKYYAAECAINSYQKGIQQQLGIMHGLIHRLDARRERSVHSPTAGHSSYAADDFPEAEHDSPYARYDIHSIALKKYQTLLFDIYLLLGLVWRRLLLSAILDSNDVLFHNVMFFKAPL
ncbi:Trafficking protein particle complex II-specific subunit 130-like [Vitis vinifera]|uniref:Trafficking protein particle complex II-specific subunit 130-like n=1 Tax=Vitis vinifera TaxID=29760 RepID=A0A438FJT5_VITVI|nr:Trafficking protein particle complex II-specific subunit 130-like [Vitis vinifera]